MSGIQISLITLVVASSIAALISVVIWALPKVIDKISPDSEEEKKD